MENVLEEYFRKICRKSEISGIGKPSASFFWTEKISDAAEKGISYL